MKAIPKIIHQVWISSEPQVPFNDLTETWKNFHPDWEYILWTQESARNFISEHFASFLEKYDNYSRIILQADAIRYLILQKFGGLYIDLDFECLENIEYLIQDAEFAAGKEPDFHAQRFDREYIIGNAFMASTAGNGFINSLCERLLISPSIEIEHCTDVLNSAGPFFLTDIYIDFQVKEKIKIIESEKIYPINMFEGNIIMNKQIPEEMANRINQASAIHYFAGNW